MKRHKCGMCAVRSFIGDIGGNGKWRQFFNWLIYADTLVKIYNKNI